MIKLKFQSSMFILYDRSVENINFPTKSVSSWIKKETSEFTMPESEFYPTDTNYFESEIEAALKGCSIGAKMGKKTSLVKKSVGLKRRNPQPTSKEHQTMLERMQREAGELPPKQKRIRSHA